MDFQWSFVRTKCNVRMPWYEVLSSWVKTQLISQYSKLECLSQPEDGEIAKDSSGGGRSNARYLGVGGQRQGLFGHLGPFRCGYHFNNYWISDELSGIFFDETDDGRCWGAICLIPLSMLPLGKILALSFGLFEVQHFSVFPNWLWQIWMEKNQGRIQSRNDLLFPGADLNGFMLACFARFIFKRRHVGIVHACGAGRQRNQMTSNATWPGCSKEEAN